MKTIKYRITSVVEFDGEIEVDEEDEPVTGISDSELLRKYLPEDVLIPSHYHSLDLIEYGYCNNYSHSYVCEVV